MRGRVPTGRLAQLREVYAELGLGDIEQSELVDLAQNMADELEALVTAVNRQQSHPWATTDIDVSAAVELLKRVLGRVP